MATDVLLNIDVSHKESFIAPEKEVKIRYGSCSMAEDKSKPDSNQDNLLILPNGAFVFDGVGGGNNSREASSLAVQKTKEVFEKEAGDGIEGIHDYQSLVRKSFLEANEAIVDVNLKIREEEPEEDKEEKTEVDEKYMSTTACGGFINEGKLYYSSVGDSRVYVLRVGKLIQLTLDDSKYLNEAFGGVTNLEREAQERLNNIRTEADIRKDEWEKLRPYFYDPVVNEEQRRHINRAIGVGNIDPLVNIFDLMPGDKVLITTDGIPDNLVDQEIIDVLKATDDPQLAARRLVELADRITRGQYGLNYLRRHTDDKTAIVINYDVKKKEETSSLEVTANLAVANKLGISKIKAYLDEVGGVQGTRAFLAASEYRWLIDLMTDTKDRTKYKNYFDEAFGLPILDIAMKHLDAGHLPPLPHDPIV